MVQFMAAKGCCLLEREESVGLPVLPGARVSAFPGTVYPRVRLVLVLAAGQIFIITILKTIICRGPETATGRCKRRICLVNYSVVPALMLLMGRSEDMEANGVATPAGWGLTKSYAHEGTFVSSYVIERFI
jgi:hypothetical protein